MRAGTGYSASCQAAQGFSIIRIIRITDNVPGGAPINHSGNHIPYVAPRRPERQARLGTTPHQGLTLAADPDVPPPRFTIITTIIISTVRLISQRNYSALRKNNLSTPAQGKSSKRLPRWLFSRRVIGWVRGTFPMHETAEECVSPAGYGGQIGKPRAFRRLLLLLDRCR